MLLLAAAPAAAATGPFELYRTADASTVRTSAVYDVASASPYTDTSGSLTDGQTYFYLVRDASAALVDLLLDKDRATGRVVATFNDIPDAPPDVDPSLSSVVLDVASVPADGVSTAVVTIVPRDSSGQPLGPGLDVTLDAWMIAPGSQSGSVQDMGDGSYVLSVVSSQIGQGLVAISVEGVPLDDQPALLFQTVFDEEFRVNVSAEGDQVQPSAGQANDGGLVTIWTGVDADGAGIFGRVFNPDGSPVGGEFNVNTTMTGDQVHPAVAVAADRRFVVVWESADASGTGIYSQLYDADGLPVGGETLVNVEQNGNQLASDVVMADDGSYVVVWQGPDSDADGVHARMFDPFGQPISDEFLVNVGDEEHSQHEPRTAITGDGRFVVLWKSTVPGWDGIYAQLYTAAGAPVGTAIEVHLGLNGQEGTPRIAMSDTGAFAVVWQGDDGSSLGVVVRSFDAAGVPFAPTEVPVNTSIGGVQNEPDVAMADDGTCMVVWHDHSSSEIHAQRFDAALVPVGAEFLVSNPAHKKPDSPVVSLAGDGSSYLIVYEAEDGDGRGVYASWVPLM